MSPRDMGDGYEPIPDVQSGNSSNGDLSPQERYPEANEGEAQLLGLLDEFIKDSTITVKLPSATIYDFPVSSSFIDFVCALVLPTVCFLLTAGLAVLYIGTDSVGDELPIFVPYAFAFLGFLSSAVPMTKRFTQHAERIAFMVDSTKRVAVKTVEDVATSVSSKVDLVKMKLCDVVIDMRPKLSKAAEQEENLKKMDPSIVIPDPNDVVSELDGAKGEIEESIRLVEENFSVTPWIPEFLRSSELYKKHVVIKVLLLCLALQMVAVYGMLLYFPSQFAAKNSVPSVKNRFLGGVASSIARVLTFHSYKADTITLSEEIFVSMNRVWPFPLVLVVEIYAMSIVQLGIVFCRTGVSATVATVNRMRSTVTEKTNHVLRQQGIFFLCQDILEIRMGRVKNKLLKMISLMFKIDMLMSMVTIDDGSVSSPTGSPTMKSPSSPRRRISGFFAKTP